jgi:hypothetical protein
MSSSEKELQDSGTSNIKRERGRERGELEVKGVQGSNE